MFKHYELRFPSTTHSTLPRTHNIIYFIVTHNIITHSWLCLKVRILFIHLLTWLHGPPGIYDSRHDKTNTHSFVSPLDLLWRFIILCFVKVHWGRKLQGHVEYNFSSRLFLNVTFL